jgi:hypothetical protein
MHRRQVRGPWPDRARDRAALARLRAQLAELYHLGDLVPNVTMRSVLRISGSAAERRFAQRS